MYTGRGAFLVSCAETKQGNLTPLLALYEASEARVGSGERPSVAIPTELIVVTLYQLYTLLILAFGVNELTKTRLSRSATDFFNQRV